MLQTNDVAVWEEGPNRTLSANQNITGIFVCDEWQGPLPNLSYYPKQRVNIKDLISAANYCVYFRVFCGHIKRSNFDVQITGNISDLGGWDVSTSPFLSADHDDPGWYSYSISLSPDDIPFE